MSNVQATVETMGAPSGNGSQKPQPNGQAARNAMTALKLAGGIVGICLGITLTAVVAVGNKDHQAIDSRISTVEAFKDDAIREQKNVASEIAGLTKQVETLTKTVEKFGDKIDSLMLRVPR
ncbi:MAG: hypothetical protein WC683_04025 [bacterium]